MDSKDDALESLMGEIMQLKNLMVDYKKMLRCMYEVSREVLDEHKQFSMDF